MYTKLEAAEPSNASKKLRKTNDKNSYEKKKKKSNNEYFLFDANIENFRRKLILFFINARRKTINMDARFFLRVHYQFLLLS